MMNVLLQIYGDYISMLQTDSGMTMCYYVKKVHVGGEAIGRAIGL